MGLRVGPVLAAVLDAQDRQDEALRYPDISRYATAIAQTARRIRADVLWPIDPGAERLLGAVEVLSRGGLTLRTWQTNVCNLQVLLVGTVGLSNAELIKSADQARVSGAAAVHGCAIDSALAGPDLDSFTVLTTGASAASKSA
jgi:hypothetical protein